MSYSLTNATTKVRELLNDTVKTKQPGDIFTYANSDVFTLWENNISSVTSVLKNDAEQAASLYSYDEDTGKVTISFSPSAGDTIEVIYTYYKKYSDTEIQNYIKRAIAELSIQQYKTFKVISSSIYPDPDDSEENLIALIASVLMEPKNKRINLTGGLTLTPENTMSTYDMIAEMIARFKKGWMIIDII